MIKTILMLKIAKIRFKNLKM